MKKDRKEGKGYNEEREGKTVGNTSEVKPDGKDSNHSAEDVKRIFNTQRASAGCSVDTSRSGFVTESQRETE